MTLNTENLSLLARQTVESGVAVWDKTNEKFIPFIPCPGEKRVRLDVYDRDLSQEFEILPVLYTKVDGMYFEFLAQTWKPLRGWTIDLS